MSIYLIRHGETPLNRARTLQHGHTPLSDAGREQARLVAQRLQTLGIRRVACSTMARARETGEAIASALRLPLTDSPLLREREFGDWCGQTYEAVGFDPFDETLAPPNGETIAQFRARVADAVAWIFEQRAQSGPNLAVVSHGLVIREVARLASESGAALRDGSLVIPGVATVAHLSNTAVSMFHDAPPLRMTLFGCDAHLVNESGSSARPGKTGGIA